MRRIARIDFDWPALKGKPWGGAVSMMHNVYLPILNGAGLTHFETEETSTIC
jgi:hypothetical protein